jgi:sugar O-acyltransferase (sialic acid O-acetyltransferase NeuD family)
MTLHIVGAGGFGRETLDALRAMSPSVAAGAVFVDERCEARMIDGIMVRRPAQIGPGTFVVAIADPRTRRRLADSMLASGLAAASVVDPRAVVSPGARLGPGCVVLGHAFISTGTALGAHVQVNYQASIGHDAVLGDCVTVLPGANVAGAVSIEPGATIGSNATVLPGLRVGSFTTIGAGAVLTRDAGPDLVLVGVPARPR